MMQTKVFFNSVNYPHIFIWVNENVKHVFPSGFHDEKFTQEISFKVA